MEAPFAAGQRPGAVFQKLGLRVRGPWPFPRPALRAAGMGGASRFRDALEELGGLYVTFGQFLAWRADLVRPEYLNVLRRLKLDIPPVPRETMTRALCLELGLPGERLAAYLEPEPLWSNLSRCAWRSNWNGQPVVVQLARPATLPAQFSRFERNVRGLREPGIAAALTPEVLRQYLEWLRLGENPARERSYLQTLAGFPHQTILEYPKPIPELCSANILCWPWVDGEPLDRLIADGSADTVQVLSEALLEGVCLVSVVDADFDLSSIVLTADGRLAMRRANRLISVPASMARTVLKYVSAVLSGNSTYANQQLVRLAIGSSSLSHEARLYDELSNLEPELKINLRFPESAGVFESNWRALARVCRERPLYLDIMHRNLLAAGYFDAETSEPGSTPDAVAESQWPVIGKLLRVRLAEFTSDDFASEWIVGSGLLALESLRQFSRMADGFRDNDLAFTLSSGVSGREDTRSANRSARAGVLIAILVMIFLLCLRWGPQAAPPWSGLIVALAVVSAAGLLGVLSRFG